MGGLTGPRHGRSRETYPQSPGAGGAVGAQKPLTRQRWIDPLTTTPPANQNGAESTPYGSIGTAGYSGPPASGFLGSLGQPTSTDDANTNFVGLISPAPLDAFGSPTIDIPAFRNVEIGSLSDASSFIGSQGNLIENPTIVWPNTATHGGSYAPTISVLTLKNLQFLNGSITITDAAGSPPSALVVLGTGAYDFYASSFDETTFDASGATGFAALISQSAFIDLEEYDAPTTSVYAAGGVLSLDCSSASPNIDTVFAQDCDAVDIADFSTAALFYFQGCSTVTLNGAFTGAGAGATFVGCDTINGIITPSASSAFIFDGPSWRSWLEETGPGPNGIGGFTAPTTVLVIGGYSAGPVSSPDGGISVSANTSISLSLSGDGATTPPWSHGGNWYEVTAVAGNTLTINLLPNNADAGDTICITYYNTDSEGGVVVVQDATTGNLGTGPQAFINDAGFIVASWNGSQWILQEVGQLPGAG